VRRWAAPGRGRDVRRSSRHAPRNVASSESVAPTPRRAGGRRARLPPWNKRASRRWPCAPRTSSRAACGSAVPQPARVSGASRTRAGGDARASACTARLRRRRLTVRAGGRRARSPLRIKRLSQRGPCAPGGESVTQTPRRAAGATELVPKIGEGVAVARRCANRRLGRGGAPFVVVAVHDEIHAQACRAAVSVCRKRHAAGPRVGRATRARKPPPRSLVARRAPKTRGQKRGG